ncbi:MAG: hypothetical protein K9L64_06950, partial [Candidatus Izimaplasma sp.]|nr:hypothetical protein [Candidatus Izimaplasma bacterium]
MKKILFLIGSIFLLFALASCDEDSTFTFPTDFTETTTDSSTTGDTSGTTEITTTTDGTTIDTTTTGGTTTTEETTTTEDTTSTEDTTTTTTEETTAEVTTVIEEQLSSPTNLAITDQSLTWDAVGDATAYQVFKDGVFLAEVTTTEYDFSALTGDTIDFAVKAIAPTGMQDSPMSLTLTYMANSTNEISSMLLFMQNSDMNISSDQEEFVTELVNRGMTTTQMQAMMTNVEPLMSAMQTATTLGGFYTELDTLMDSATNIEALISALIRVELPAILAADLEYYQTNDGTCDDYDEYSDTCYYYHDFTDDIQNTQNMLYFLENHPDEAVQSVMVVVNYLMRVQDNITTDWVSDLDTLLATPSPDAMDITLAVSVKNGLVNNLYTELPTLEEFTLFNQTMLSFASIMLEDNTMETYVKAHKLSQQMHFSFRFVFDYLLMIDYDYIDGMLAAMVQADKLSAAEDILVLQLDYLNTFLDNNQDKFTDFNAIYTDAEKEAFFFDVIVTQILNANMYSPGTPEFDEVMLIIESNVEFTDLLALQNFSSAQFNALLDRLFETDYAMIHDAFALARIEQNFETYTTYDEYVTARQAAQFDLVDSLLITINPIIQNMTNEEKTMVLENILSFAVVGLELELDHYQAKDGTCAWYDELADECYETYDFTEDIQNLENMLYFLENNSDDAIQSVIIVLDYFGAIQNDISSTWLTDLETLMQTPSPDQLDVLLAISVKNELITNLKTELPTITDFTLFNETMLTLASVMLEDDTFQTDIAADKLAQQMHISLELFYDYLLMIDADYVNGMFSAMANEDQLLMNKEILILQLEYLDMFLTDNQVKLDDLNAIYTDIEKETFFYDILITQLINAQGYSPGTTEFNELMLIFEDDIDFTNLLALQDLASDNMNALLDQLLLTDFALIHDIFDMIEIEQSYYDYLDPEDFYYDISIAQFELMDSLVTTLNPIIQDMTAAEYTVLIENITSIITLIAEVEDYEYGNPDLSAIYLMMASLEDTSPDQLALIQALFAEVDSSGLIDSLKALYIEGLDSANPDLQTYGLILEIANVYINVYTDAGTNMDAIVTEFLALLNTTEVQTALGITQADVDELALLLDGYLQAVYDQAMII